MTLRGDGVSRVAEFPYGNGERQGVCGFGSSLDVSKGHQESRSTGLEPKSSDFSAMGFIMVL